jgi:hypothetical protein|tara:strand:+ start:359 stop:595 length:237 start_codon:yes stop_codon:yes gene_type:complete
MTRRFALLATLIAASFVSAHALDCDDIPDSVTCDRCTGDRAGHGVRHSPSSRFFGSLFRINLNPLAPPVCLFRPAALL